MPSTSSPDTKEHQKKFSGLRARFLKMAALSSILFVALLFFFFQSTFKLDRTALAERYANELASTISERENLTFNSLPKEIISISRAGKKVWENPRFRDAFDNHDSVLGSHADIEIRIRNPDTHQRPYLFVVLVFIFIAGVFIFAFYAWFGLSVMSPLRTIRLAAKRAAAGDFTLPIQEFRDDEFGSVAHNFNEMFAALNNYKTSLESRLKELEQANTSLQNAKSSLFRSEKLASIGQLAAGVAHEIGNPLASVSGYIELIEGGDLEESEVDDIIHRISAQLDRIHIIIRGLLDYSRQGTDEPEDTFLLSTIKQAVELAKAIQNAREIEFVFPKKESDQLVHAIPTQLVQILLNLILNAADAIETGENIVKGVITFELIDKENYVHLVVIDNGPGIPEGNLKKIFDPFFTTKEPGKGTGLGLAIVHQMMTGMGGDIFVNSNHLNSDNQGSRFTLILPKNAE